MARLLIVEADPAVRSQVVLRQTLAGANIGFAMEIDIQPCTSSDIPLLEEAIPTKGDWHAKRVAEQESGGATYLIA